MLLLILRRIRFDFDLKKYFSLFVTFSCFFLLGIRLQEYHYGIVIILAKLCCDCVFLIKFCGERFWSNRKGHLTTELLKFIERPSIQVIKIKLDFVKFVYHNDEYS